jgi:hypothetical protein
MSLAITIVLALLLLLAAGIGARRDLRRGALALGGTLLGATLGGFWSDLWGVNLSARLRIEPATAVALVGAILLLSVALLVGYGGGVLLKPARTPPTWRQMLIGGALGLINGCALLGYLLRFWSRANPSFTAQFATAPLAQVLHDGLPLLTLAAALAGGLSVVIAYAIRASRERSARPASVGPPRPSVAPPRPVERPPAISTPEQLEKQRRALDKINDALK